MECRLYVTAPGLSNATQGNWQPQLVSASTLQVEKVMESQRSDRETEGYVSSDDGLDALTQVAALQSQMDAAVEAEDFVLAATLRDKMRTLKVQPPPGPTRLPPAFRRMHPMHLVSANCLAPDPPTSCLAAPTSCRLHTRMQPMHVATHATHAP